MIKLIVPVYYTQEFKTKPSKTILIGLNWYRNAHYFQQNAVKAYMSEIILNQLKTNTYSIIGPYSVEYKYYYKSAVSDMSNVTPMASKWVNDCLQEAKLVPNDNVKYLVRELHTVETQDKLNPRVEVIITNKKENTHEQSNIN